MRCNMLQKCGLPYATDWDTCSPSQYESYTQKLLRNTLMLRNWHQVDGRCSTEWPTALGRAA